MPIFFRQLTAEIIGTLIALYHRTLQIPNIFYAAFRIDRIFVGILKATSLYGDIFAPLQFLDERYAVEQLAVLACLAAMISLVLAGRALLASPAVPASAEISYTVQSENDRLVIRQSDGSVLRTGIDTRTLPSAEQQALADGITLDNAEELTRLLENYSS